MQILECYCSQRVTDCSPTDSSPTGQFADTTVHRHPVHRQPVHRQDSSPTGQFTDKCNFEKLLEFNINYGRKFMNHFTDFLEVFLNKSFRFTRDIAQA
jgi:hypothetical protein